MLLNCRRRRAIIFHFISIKTSSTNRIYKNNFCLVSFHISNQGGNSKRTGGSSQRRYVVFSAE